MTNEPATTDRRWYRFGPFLMDASKRLLWRGRTLVPVTAKAFEILVILVERRAHVVHKQDLMEAVWGQTAVEENTLTRHISTLRKALDERPDHHHYILTVPGHGYQFVADVDELARPDDPPMPASAAPSAANAAGDSAPVLVNAATAPVARADLAGRVANDDQTGPSLALDHPAPQASVGLARPFRPAGLARTLAAVVVLTIVTTTLAISVLRVEQGARPDTHRPLRQFTFQAGLQRNPAWSPDGRWVAYVSDHAGNSDIWIQPLDDPTPIQITSSPAEDSQPDWSPDGRLLVFRSERDGGGLYVVPARGGVERRISDTGYHPRWSPDGSLVLFSSSGHAGGARRFQVVAADGGAPREVRPDLFTDFTPTYVGWTPGSATVSFLVRRPQDDWSFWTVPLAAGPGVKSDLAPAVAQRIASLELTIGSFVWAPSRRHLYFEGRVQATQSVWRVTVDPDTLAWIDGPDRLTTGTTRDADVAISADGRHLIFSAGSVRSRLWMFPFDAVTGRVMGDGQPVTSGGAGEQDADTPDDGSKLVYRTVRAGRQELWERGIAAERARLVIGSGEWTRTRPRWSADGSQIAYLRRPVESGGALSGSAVAVYSVAQGREHLLTAPGDQELVPTDWSRDGKSLLGACPRGTPRRAGTCALELPGNGRQGRMRVIAADPAYHFYEQRFSPDQRWISFVAVSARDAAASTIVVIPAAGGEWHAVTDGLLYDDKPHWSPDGRTLYYVSPRNGLLNVWGRRFDADAGLPLGQPFQVTSFSRPSQSISTELSQMQIAVTSHRLFLPLTESHSELWILENAER